jgi:hypothetical protein
LPVLSFLLLAAAPALAAPPSPAAGAGSPVRLVPHRAVYDLSLLSTRGARGIETARGRIAFDFTGNACEGYALKFRQVTVLTSTESGSKTSDLRTAHYESGDGRTFRFRHDTKTEEQNKSVDGDAERKAGGPLGVRLKTPKRDRFDLDGDAVFPNAQMRELIIAAREGRSTAPMKVFDGSEEGRNVYETLAVIGSAVKAKPGEKLEEAARQDKLAALTRWPVTLSYFKTGRGEQTPVYVLSFELYENGVSRALKLDYGDFALRGEMTKLELLPDTACQR